MSHVLEVNPEDWTQHMGGAPARDTFVQATPFPCGPDKMVCAATRVDMCPAHEAYSGKTESNCVWPSTLGPPFPAVMAPHAWSGLCISLPWEA